MDRRRQHGEGSLFRRSRDGRWVAVAELGKRNGKRERRYFVAATPAAAIARRAAFLDRKRDGFTMPKGRQPTVSDWCLHWLHNVIRRKVEATTWEKSYRQKVTDHIAPYFENVLLSELTEEDIEYWHEELESKVSERTGRPLSAATISHAHRIMSTAIKAAVVRKKLPRNPLSNVPPPKAAPAEIEPPSQEEVLQVLERCRTWPNGARWVLAITTGLRQGEALGLEWKDVKLTDPPSVTVRQSAARVAGQRVTKQPKSAASRRTVPLPAVAVAALRELRESSVRSVRDDWVFRGVKLGRMVEQKQDWQDWRRLLDDLGLPHYRVHDLRHGYATMLLESGVPDRVVMELLGWSSLAMTKRYQHVRPVLHKAAADAIDRALGGA